MKRLSLLLSIMMLVMLLCPAAYGSDWPQFQKDELNSGIYSGVALPTSSYNVTSAATQGGGWMGVDSSPIYAGDYAYVYPITNIYELTGAPASFGVNDQATVDTTGAFQLSSPAYSDDAIYVGVNDMVNQTTNKNFTTDLTGWTTGSSISPAPAFSQATVGSKTCAQIYEDSSSTNGDGYIKQTVTKPSGTTMRLQFSYYQHYDSATPSASTINVWAKSGATETRIYTATATTYDEWVPVNENISYSPTGSIEIRYEWDYTTAGSGAYCCFTDCQFIAQSMGVKKVTGLGSDLVVDDSFCSLKAAGQANTPVKVFEYGGDEYVVLGSWASVSSGNYYCVNTSDGSLKWTFTPTTPAGFYWAGAACTGGAVIFGDDKGYVHVVNVSDGTEADVYDPAPSSSAYIRTSVCYYDVDNSTDDYLYLADYQGNLYQLTYDSANKEITASQSIKEGTVDYSTSTPVRINDKVFYGTEEGLCVATIVSNSFDSVDLLDDDIDDKMQASPVVYEAGTDDYYIYVTTNIASGAAHCIHYYLDEYDEWQHETGWTYTNNNYTLQGFAAANGRLYFGDDSGKVYCIY